MVLADYVRALESKTREEKRKILFGFMRKHKFKFFCQIFKWHWINGMNVISETGKGKKEIILAAHYDNFMHTPGANDNASSIAVLLDVHKKLQRCKLNCKIKTIFFDREEWIFKRLGSEAYVKQYGFENLIAMYNLEMVGVGEVVIVWPVSHEEKNLFAFLKLKEILEKFHYKYKKMHMLPVVSSDHMSFRKKGFKNAFCISLVPEEKIKLLEKIFNTSAIRFLRNYFMCKIMGKHKEEFPFFFRIYHDREDKACNIREKSLEMTSKILVALVRKISKEAK